MATSAIQFHRHQEELKSLRADKAKLQADVSALEAKVGWLDGHLKHQIRLKLDAYERVEEPKAEVASLQGDLRVCRDTLNTQAASTLKAGRAFRALHRENERLREAMYPFAACVFNDNGDVTVNTGRLHHEDWLRAYNVFKETGND